MTVESTRTRRWIVASAGLLALLVVAWLIVAQRRANVATAKAASGPASRDALSVRAMQGMQGMEGMTDMAGSADGNVHLTPAQIRQFGITLGGGAR
jgi:hypothetical protein